MRRTLPTHVPVTYGLKSGQYAALAFARAWLAVFCALLTAEEDGLLLAADSAVAAAAAVSRSPSSTAPSRRAGRPAVPPAPYRRLLRYSPVSIAHGRFFVQQGRRTGLPVKAHLSHEPAIPEAAALTVVLTGASGFGRPIREAVHRWERFCQLTGASPEEPVTAEGLAALLMAESTSTQSARAASSSMVWTGAASLPSGAGRPAQLDRPVFAGTLKGGIWKCLS